MPCARDHCLQDKDICAQLKAILGLPLHGPLLEQFKFGIGLLPSFGLQTEVIPGATLLLAQRSLREGQPLVGEQQGRARELL